MNEQPEADGAGQDAAAGPDTNAEDHAPDPLTGIRLAYTLASPQEQNGNGIDRMMLRQFMETLAEVAMAVASRGVIE